MGSLLTSDGHRCRHSRPPPTPAKVLSVHSLRGALPKLRPINRHPNSGESSNSTPRLGSGRKLGPPGKKRTTRSSETVPQTPQPITRNFPPQLTHPKAGSPTPAGAFLPPGLGLGSRGRAGRSEGESCPGALFGKSGRDQRGGGPRRRTAGRESDGDSLGEDFYFIKGKVKCSWGLIGTSGPQCRDP